jgi:RimJ/RimL family protein N-acetyltransferase
MLPIETPRLALRDFRDADFEAVHAYASDPEVTRFMAWGPNDAELTREFLARAAALAREAPRSAWELAIADRARDEVIGSCGAYARRAHYDEWEIGYVLGRPYWRRGLGAEAVGALVGFAFERLGAHRLFATVDPANAASAGLLRRLGFRLEGHQRADTRVRGAWRDSLVFARLATEREKGAAEAAAGVGLEVTEQPAAHELEALGRGLSEHGAPVTGSPGFRPLAVLARDADGALVGGCSGQVSWNWLHVQLLWLDPAHRGTGLGARIMDAIEEAARRRGCTDAHLDTFSWQAAPFYERRGYTRFATLEDYPPGERRHFLRKRLVARPPG